MEKVEIFEQELTDSSKKKVGKLAIIRGGLNTDNPTAIMNNAVSKYVANKGYNEFVEVHLDNPWVRVIIGGINDLKYEPFDKHRL